MILEAVFQLLGTVLEALLELLWHSFRGRSHWWWIPPATVAAVLLALAWAFHDSDGGVVPAVLIALAVAMLGARALLMRRA